MRKERPLGLGTYLGRNPNVENLKKLNKWMENNGYHE